MKKIAVVTYESRGSYAVETVPDEDVTLEAILTELGYQHTFEVWSDLSVDWTLYDLLLIKSPWDYFDKYEAFLIWLDKIKTLGIPTLNGIDTIKWNSDKRYLQDIQSKGFPIVPTYFLEKGDLDDEINFFEYFKKENVIIKPTISGGSKNTLKINRSDWEYKIEDIKKLLESEEFMVQPFVDEIASEGEYSYLYFNGKFSHAVLKSPKPGEFRVQHFFGGEIAMIKPTSEQLASIDQLVKTFASETLYARVDGVWVEGIFYLMELELIEPYLFLFVTLQGLENYKLAIQERISYIIA